MEERSKPGTISRRFLTVAGLSSFLVPPEAEAHDRSRRSQASHPAALPASYIVVDATPGLPPAEIVSYQQDLQRRPASLTKLMTAWLLCQTLADDAEKIPSERIFPKGLDTLIPISKDAAAASGSHLGVKAGTRVSAQTLATGMMTISANDAATALGEAIAGPDRKAADLMNAEARRLGMLSSRFFDYSGQDILLPNAPQTNLSTARDIATLAAALYHTYGEKFPGFLHPAKVKFAGQVHENIENDVLGTRQGDLGQVVMAKGGINVGGHDTAVVMSNGEKTYVMVMMGAKDTPSLKSERERILEKAGAIVKVAGSRIGDAAKPTGAPKPRLSPLPK